MSGRSGSGQGGGSDSGKEPMSISGQSNDISMASCTSPEREMQLVKSFAVSIIGNTRLRALIEWNIEGDIQENENDKSKDPLTRLRICLARVLTANPGTGPQNDFAILPPEVARGFNDLDAALVKLGSSIGKVLHRQYWIHCDDFYEKSGDEEYYMDRRRTLTVVNTLLAREPGIGQSRTLIQWFRDQCQRVVDMRHNEDLLRIAPHFPGAAQAVIDAFTRLENVMKYFTDGLN